jgi:peptidoglycan/xylan/chitin deacetylase (PgdA/CDA1 family)
VLRVAGVPLAAFVGLLLRMTGRRAGVALIYHSLAARTGDARTELVPAHGAELFAAQVRHLARTYRVVSAAELPDAVARRRRGERFPVAVTFDDDLSSHVSLAAPILRRAGAQATFFLTGAALRAPYAFWWERLQRVADTDPARLQTLFADADLAKGETRTLHALGRWVESLAPEERQAFADSLRDSDGDHEAGLSADGVRALLDAGMDVGFHTRRHDPLPDLDEASLAAAFEKGRDELEEVVGSRLTIVAYPHGRADERVAAAAGRAGITIGYTGYGGAVRPGDEPLMLRRLGPSYRSAGHFAVQVVATLLRARG